jgi:hypothetical protein
MRHSVQRVAIGVCTLLSVAWMSGASVCGCPANCSPGPCVDVNNSCMSRTLTAPTHCVWEECTGYEWNAPGPSQVTHTTAGNCTCQLTKGILVNGICVFDPNAIPYSYPTVPCVVGVTVITCPT